MFLLTKKGRTAYLTFIRNLPSQIALLAPCFFLPQLKEFSWLDILDVAVWLAFFAMFMYAAIANIFEFVEAAINTIHVNRIIKALRNSGVSGWRLYPRTMKRIPISEWGSILLVIAFIYGSFGLIFLMVIWTYFKP